MTINQLANETSPYLLQHKDNPVHWYPWSDVALEKARRENKPILLSVGYSACHWCHVMAHESFENKETARLMNELFVNIKVDREERPDLDKIYQNAHSMLTQRPGGWPLTIFLTPDEHMPFYAGTYFPPEARYGMPAFREILLRVADAYNNNQQSIESQNRSVRDVFQRIEKLQQESTDKISARPLDTARSQLLQSFDTEHGGFGAAPKFPHPTNIELALRYWSSSVKNNQEDFEILHTAVFTLEKMAQGGLFDQIGGGFYRYSTDNYWTIPHFEKMLYDNGPLLSLYSFAWQVFQRPLFEQVLHDTADWVINEMQSDKGGYYSSLDADSDGEEGRFYVWQPEEIKTALHHESYPLFAEHFGLYKEANFEDKAWHLCIQTPLTEIADRYNLDLQSVRKTISDSRQILLKLRARRTPPGRDEKILTSWNALMIKGMATASRVTGKQAYIDSACRALDFIHSTHWQSGKLLATSKGNRAHLNAYLDDYAYLLDAILEVLSVKWNNNYFSFARDITNTLLDNFEDKQHGGFYFTSHDHEKLITRQKSYNDDAMPSGNGIAIIALYKIGILTGDNHYVAAAENALGNGYNSAEQSPMGHACLLLALDTYLNNVYCVVIRGNPAELDSWREQLSQKFLPRASFFFIENSEADKHFSNKKAGDSVTAYICHSTGCLPPVQNIDELIHSVE